MPYILHIDDCEIDRRILDRNLQLRYKDIEIKSFTNVASAEAYINTIGEAGVRIPDLIITDNNMPGKNGFEFVEFVKSLPKLSSVPIVMLSSSILGEDIAKAYSLGVESYYSKPITPAAVDHIISLLKRP